MSGDAEGPFVRWSRLKRQRRNEDEERERRRGGAAPVAVPEQPPPVPGASAGVPAPVGQETKAAADPGLPSVEGLTKDSDFTPFLRPGVPDGVKRAALNKLWRSDPFFNRPDELFDGGLDYNAYPTITAAATAYRVGRGFLDAIEEVVKETVAAESPPEAEAAADPAPQDTASESATPGGGAKDSGTS